MEREQSENTTSTTSDAAVESTVGPSTKVPGSDEEQPEQTNSNPPTPIEHPRGTKRSRDMDDDETQEGADDEDASSESGDLTTKSKEVS